MKFSHRIAILSIWIPLALSPIAARADTEHEGTFWTGYMSSWWLDPSRALWFDTHYNVDTFFLVRFGLTHRFEKGPSFTGGYAFLLLNPDFERYEHRPWAQVFAPYHFNDKWSISGRFRVDFRFQETLVNERLASGYDFIIRTRFQTVLTRRFARLKWGRPSIQLAHEILLNAYADPSREVVNQNRVSLLFGLEQKYMTVRVGYMNRYLPHARGGNGFMEHAAILWFTQSVDLYERRRQKREPDYDYADFPEYGGP